MDMEKLVALCKRRGFIFQASEIYGGLNGFWDYGPLGAELKKNIKDAWWQDMVRNPPPGPDGQEISMVGLDSAIIQNPKVWQASGHATGFQDPMVDCKTEGCKGRFRADKVFIGTIVPPTVPSSMTGPGKATSIEADSIEDAKAYFDAERKKLLDKGKIQANFQAKVWPISSAPDDLRQCPKCQSKGLTAPRSFNLMFKTFVGAMEDAAAEAWLRPETAQGIFTNFKNVVDSSRVRPPFGIAQIGKAFRNEINPRNYTFRSREFEQMEIEFFCHPDESMKWYEYWRSLRLSWYSKLGINSEKLRPREQGEKELAHYSKACTDIEYLFPFSEEPQELEGVAHRGAFDLTQHMQHSGKDLQYFDEEAWAKFDKTGIKGDKKAEAEAKAKFRYVPHVIEPSAGADRFTLAVLCEAYTEDKAPNDKGELEERLVMKFHPRLAPIKAAILPLVNKEGMPDIALKLYRELKQDWNVYFDDGGAIGRRYRRQDEIGTPFCFTIDGQTLQDQTVTVRYRDTLKQERIAIAEVPGKLREWLRG